MEDERRFCYCCEFEIEDPNPWTTLNTKNEIVYLCDSCMNELAHFIEISSKAKMLSMRSEKKLQNEQRENRQIPEQMRLI